MNLPMPTEKDLAEFVARFLGSFGEAPGYPSAALAKALGTISYAEAEEFCLDVRRRQVLAMGEASLKSIVGEQLKMWTTQAHKSDDSKQRSRNGGTSATDPSTA